ncbi:MAG: DnaD domain protein [Clostridia bacterium]|nr:DnaD domain protein [Clostridia bacterium]
MPKVVIKQEYVAVSTRLIDEVFPTTNAVFIKVYLHILMLSATGSEIVFSVIADRLQLLESDVLQAVRYWQNMGVIQVLDDGVADTSAAPPPSVSEADEKSDEHPMYDIGEISKHIEDNEKLSEMMQLSQEVLGRTLSSAEMKSLYWFYDKLEFSPEVILMLLEYCVSIGKKSMTYIERVASGWHKRGLDSIEAVESFLNENETKKKYMNNLKQLFGIRERSLTGIEEEYLEKWHDTLDMSEEMIALAYEYCILRINKISFPYMDKIISNWHEKGISTIPEAEKENEEFKQNHAGSSDFEILEKDQDADELERITWGKLDQ